MQAAAPLPSRLRSFSGPALLLASALAGSLSHAQSPPPQPDPALLLEAQPPPTSETAPAPDPTPPPPKPPAPSLPRTRFNSAPASPQRRPGEPERIRMSPSLDMQESSIRNGQYHVWGRDRDQRRVLLSAAAETQRLFLTALRLPPAFRHPIVVQIRDSGSLRPGTRPVWSEISEISGGFRFEINVVPENKVVPGDLWREEIVRCLLAEIILRDRSGSDLSGTDAPPPDWLLHGTLEMLSYQATGRPSEAFASVFRLGHVLPLEDIFRAEPRGMDTVSRSIYRASCCGLIQMLLEQPNGPASMAALLPALASAGDDPSSAIARSFPALTASGNSLPKWWALQLATMAQPGADEILSPKDSDAALSSALVFLLPADPDAATKPSPKPQGRLKRLFSRKKSAAEPQPADPPAPAAATPDSADRSLPFSSWPDVLKRKDRAAILSGTSLALTKLSIRAHPLYRPLIADYLAVIKDLETGKHLKDVPERLRKTDATAASLRAELSRIEDYLDWFEATQQEEQGDEFRDYLRAEDELKRPPPPRNDPISRYLDEVAREFEE